MVKKYLESDMRHEWYARGMAKEQLEKIQSFYNERYGGTTAKEGSLQRGSDALLFLLTATGDSFASDNAKRVKYRA